MEPGEIFKDVLRVVDPGQPVFLVGGAVRDRILGREIHDYDFTLSGDTRAAARKIADQHEGAFYPLDEERGTYRVILTGPRREQYALDFAVMRADSLDADLRGRDFTINAMAVDLAHPEQVIDPLGGERDLQERILRACAATSIKDDPVRALRAVRLEMTLDLKVDSATETQIRKSPGWLERISQERVRDELFRILDLGRGDEGLQRLEKYGLFSVILPDLGGLKGLRQSPPHIYPGWEHTLEVVRRLDQVWSLLVSAEVPPTHMDEFLAQAHAVLGRFHEPLVNHYGRLLVPLRNIHGLVVFSALYHDSAKPITSTTDPNGRIRFFNHDERGARIAARRARILTLSSAEIERIDTVISGHMRVHQLVDTAQNPSLRAIYRYFRATHEAGIDICFLSLADTLGTYGETLPMEHWLRVLRTVELLLEAYFHQPEKTVSPPRLITGDDLLREFGLKPGPVIGRILEAVREAQVAGEVKNRSEAISLADQIRNEV